MYSGLIRGACAICVVGVVVLAAVAVIGCGNVSPFLSLHFAANSELQDTQGTPQPLPQPDGTSGEVLASVCNLSEELRTIQVTLENDSADNVRFAMTFIASTGPGGFVCTDEVEEYLSAGYVRQNTNTIVIGCDTVVLGGSQLLILEYGYNEIPESWIQRATIDGTTVTATLLALTRRNQASRIDIPLPELIVFGTDDSLFECSGSGSNRLCTQRGFVYVTDALVSTGKPVEASRIQGTPCAENFGTAPEWYLDKTTLDGTIQSFQYPAGGSILVQILDRSTDSLTTNRNQVVWTVLNSAGTTVHSPNS